MAEPPDHESRPERNPRRFRDFDGSTKRFNLTAQIRVHGYWTSRPDDDPPDETMIRVKERLYVLWGDMDSGYNRISLREARTWLRARQNFARGKYFESWYAKMPPDLQSIVEGGPDSPAIATTAGSPAGKEEGKGSADGPKTLDDLNRTAWKLLRAMYALGAFDTETVRTHQQIVKKAGTGNHGSGHNKEAFAALQKLGLIKSRRRVGTWLTQAGRELIESHQSPA
jgi:hypothetical protein